MDELLKNYDVLPKEREWDAKIFSVPKIPRGDDGQVQVFINILQAVSEGMPLNSCFQVKGSNSKATLDRLCVWLRPIGVVYKESGRWFLTDVGKVCLQEKNPMYITAVFHSAIRFFGEILWIMNEPMKIQELLTYANEQYFVNWKTKSEISNRLTWLREVGMVAYNDYRMEYVRTELGTTFLNYISITKPDELLKDKDNVTDDIEISNWVKKYCGLSQDKLSNRINNIGYIPGNTADYVETVAGYLQLLSNETDVEIIRMYSKEIFGISKSSSNLFITFLERLGFVERKSRQTYMVSEEGVLWLQEKNIYDLLICIHSKFKFIFEILKEIEVTPKTTQELSVLNKVLYGFNREAVDEIRKRIIMLKEAGLIEEKGKSENCLTSKGKHILNLISIQKTVIVDDANKAEDMKKDDAIALPEKLILEMRLASTDSANPNRFEKAICEIFTYLGFHSQWLGGSGKTDCLLQSQGATNYTYKVAVDAKSTGSGNVTDGLIDFDTLKEHKSLHNAKYSAVVGCSFSGERVNKRAIDKTHPVALIDVSDLEKMVILHSDIPLSTEDYELIFRQSGKVDIDVLNSRRNKVERYGKLVQGVMSCLEEECNDPITNGILNIREIYRSIRDKNVVGDNPDMEEISNILSLLSSPLIHCIEEKSGEYRAIGSLKDAEKKFEFYARACVK